MLVAKFGRYSLQVVFIAKNRSLLVAEVAGCKKMLVTCCKIRLLLVAEVAPWKKLLTYYCEIPSLLVAKRVEFFEVVKVFSLQKLHVLKNNWFPVAKFICFYCRRCLLQKIIRHFLIQSPAGILVCLKLEKLVETFIFFNLVRFLKPKNLKLL